VEIAADSAELSYQVNNDLGFLDDLLVNQGRLQQENQGAVLRTRMVPVKTVVPRLQRSVRQTCRLINKEVNLDVSGVNTLMDSNVLNDLVDPLMHMLRNAVDHGIETAEVRQSMGKDPVGRIHLAFFREGNRVVVRCQDDGAGLDLQAIRATAERRNLIAPNKQLEDDEIIRLILVSGFSTRTATTQTSGRGIGMDAVYSRVKELKGSLNIKSEAGKGCLLELRLPLTLISTHALLVSVNNQRFALSDRGVEQILYPGIGEVRRLGNSTTYQLDNDIYECSILEELLDLPRNSNSTDHCPVLLVQDDAGATRAIMVQEVLDSRDMVIKNLGYYIPKLAGVAGATILGDGSVVPVLDLPDLLRVPLPSLVSTHTQSQAEVGQQTDNNHQRCALIVDDSLSARRSLAQFIEDTGFEVHTAIDGLEAINTMASKIPDLLLVDMEMPRMNGLELTSHVRANEATRDVPVIMITSRSTEKHRQKAKSVGVNFYMTKPFSEDELLENIGSALRNA
jgi:chemosensory pili system protein ChpA (sensor histidine kinase/response regulator)